MRVYLSQKTIGHIQHLNGGWSALGLNTFELEANCIETLGLNPPQRSRSPAQQRRYCMAEATNPHSSLQGNCIIQNQQGDTTNLQSQSLTTYRKSTSLLCLLPSICLLGNLHSWCSSRTSPAWSRGIQTWQPAISDTEGPWRALREVVHSCSSPSELNGFLSCNTKYFFKNKSPETCFKCHFELNIITWMF